MIVTTLSAMPFTAYAGFKCEGCDEWKQDSKRCKECKQCEDCVELCESCGEVCHDCMPYCEECGRCRECCSAGGYELCEGCEALCIECASGQFCEECHLCMNCTDICDKCGGHCWDCNPGCEECGQCGHCLEMEGIEGRCEGCNRCSKCLEDAGFEERCDSCGLCEDCVGTLCQDCGRCESCSTEFCSNCGEYCGECRTICEDCGVCSECNSDSVCENCGAGCASCAVICENCGSCSHCETICTNGDNCSNCASICLNCGLCSECAIICEECGEHCSDCADYFCEDCNRCSECVEICKGCGRCHDSIGGSFCENCGTCSNCATLCEDKDYCSACSVICKDCGGCELVCRENGGAICRGCGLCANCHAKIACLVCEKCSDCTVFTPTKYNGKDDYNVICDKCIGDYPDLDDLTVDFGQMVIGQPINFDPTFSGKSAKYVTGYEIYWRKIAENGKQTLCNKGDLYEPGYKYYFEAIFDISIVNINKRVVSNINFAGLEIDEVIRADVAFCTDYNYAWFSLETMPQYASYPEYDSNSLYAITREDAFYVSARDITATTTYIASGKLRVGETVAIITPDGTVKRVKVAFLEMFKKTLDEVSKGDSCSIAFARSDISPSEIPAGSLILADNGTILSYTPAGARISGAFSMLEGTNVASMSSGSDVKVNVGGQSYTGKIYSSNGEDFKENNEVSAILVLDSAVPIYNSQSLAITYGSRYVGDFRVDTLIKATDFNITKTNYECQHPDSGVKIETIFTPANATYGVTWESLNPEVATVDSLGNVKTHSVGTAVIRASLGDKVIDCTVTVTCRHFISVHPHTGKESTCTEHGYTEYHSCRYCGMIYDGKEELPLLPHEYELTGETAPTCAKEGAKVYTCTACGGTMTESIEKLPHTPEVIPAVPATCTASGLTEGSKCSVCGEVITAQKTVAKKAHTTKTTVTKATLSKDGKSVTKCTACGTTTSTKTIACPKTFKLSATSYTYDGKAKKPSVTVKDSKGNTISAGNYTVSYSNNKNVGKATVKITFKGNYSGTKSLTFKINPKGTTVNSVTAKSKGFTVKWNKQTAQTTGYEIQYSTDKNFKSGNKTVTVSKNSTTSKKVTNLKSKKKYYVRVRTYKTVSGKKYYSSWSKAKTVTTK